MVYGPNLQSTIIHRIPSSKIGTMIKENSKETLIDDSERITKLEKQIKNFTASISKLLENLISPLASISKERYLKKKDDGQNEEEEYVNPNIRDNKEEPTQDRNPKNTLKINFKVNIPMYRDNINAKKLDNWIDRLKTYYKIYKYYNSQKIKFTSLKLSSHAITRLRSYQ